MTKLLTKEHVKAMVKALESAGLPLEKDWQAGTVRAYIEGKEIFAALEKGKNQPWIVRHVDDLFA
jgi:hypothetical protein